MTLSRTRLDKFNPSVGFNRGKSDFVFASWYLIKCFFFSSSLPWPSGLKAFILRLFGAQLGSGVVIKPRVNIHFPWKLALGDFVWLGEEVNIINFEQVRIGSNACISQQVFLCAAGHDYRDPAFSYRNAPISIGSGVWLQARVFVCPGVSIGEEALVTACSFVKDDLPANRLCTGNPAVPAGLRWK
jgi:putative colanic acid biosynthesis acetyltransferase WcaF